MADRNDTTSGPESALSTLYEANDLLNVLRDHSEESAPMSAAHWTLTVEIKRRLDSAIADLDRAVPETERPVIHEPEMRKIIEANIAAEREPEATLERGQYLLLVGDGIYDTVSGISGIADALEGPLFEDIGDDAVQRLVLALKSLSHRLLDASDDAPLELQQKVRNAVEAPDSGAEKMAKRLREKGYFLWSDPRQANVFGVSDRNFAQMKMSICSLDEIDAWLETAPALDEYGRVKGGSA